MLSYEPSELEKRRKLFDDICMTNGDINQDWLDEQKTHFNTVCDQIKDYYDRFNRNKGKLQKKLDDENIPIPLYLLEYDLEDVKEEYIDNISIKDELRKENIHKLMNKLIVLNKAIVIKYAELDEIINQLSNKKGIKNVNTLEDDTFDEQYHDIDAERRNRGIVLSETAFIEDDYLQDNMDYTFTGEYCLKDLARMIYDDESYWTYIYNYSDNENIISNFLDINKISSDMIDKIASDPTFLRGAKIKVPKEITIYTDEFNTKVLKKVKP